MCVCMLRPETLPLKGHPRTIHLFLKHILVFWGRYLFSCFILSVWCVCVRAVCVHIWVQTGISMCTWRPEKILVVLLDHSPPDSLETGSLTQPGVRLAVGKHQPHSYLCSHRVGLQPCAWLCVCPGRLQLRSSWVLR